MHRGFAHGKAKRNQFLGGNERVPAAFTHRRGDSTGSNLPHAATNARNPRISLLYDQLDCTIHIVPRGRLVRGFKPIYAVPRVLAARDNGSGRPSLHFVVGGDWYASKNGSMTKEGLSNEPQLNSALFFSNCSSETTDYFGNRCEV